MLQAAHHADGRRTPPHEIRDGRIKVSLELLQLMLRDVAGLPVLAQADVREAVKRLQRVQEWCQHHGPGL
jgi:hypothetical protein